MAFRFRKSFGGQGFRINLSKSGLSYSLGGAPFTMNFKPGRRTMYTASLPGTGMSDPAPPYSDKPAPNPHLPPGRFNRIEPRLLPPPPELHVPYQRQNIDSYQPPSFYKWPYLIRVCEGKQIKGYLSIHGDFLQSHVTPVAQFDLDAAIQMVEKVISNETIRNLGLVYEIETADLLEGRYYTIYRYEP